MLFDNPRAQIRACKESKFDSCVAESMENFTGKYLLPSVLIMFQIKSIRITTFCCKSYRSKQLNRKLYPYKLLSNFDWKSYRTHLMFTKK